MTNASTQADDAAQRVLDHHLGAFAQGLDEIIKEYDKSSTIITPGKSYRGLEEIRAFFKAFLESADPGFWSAFKISSQSTAGDVAYLAWEARPWVKFATDTLVVKNGKIAVQTFTSFSD